MPCFFFGRHSESEEVGGGGGRGGNEEERGQFSSAVILLAADSGNFRIRPTEHMWTGCNTDDVTRLAGDYPSLTPPPTLHSSYRNATDLPPKNLLKGRLVRLASGELESPPRVGLDASHHHSGTDRVRLLAARGRGKGFSATPSPPLSLAAALLLLLFWCCRRGRRRRRSRRRCYCWCWCWRSAVLRLQPSTACGGGLGDRNCAGGATAGAHAGRV